MEEGKATEPVSQEFGRPLDGAVDGPACHQDVPSLDFPVGGPLPPAGVINQPGLRRSERLSEVASASAPASPFLPAGRADNLEVAPVGPFSVRMGSASRAQPEREARAPSASTSPPSLAVSAQYVPPPSQQHEVSAPAQPSPSVNSAAAALSSTFEMAEYPGQSRPALVSAPSAQDRLLGASFNVSSICQDDYVPAHAPHVPVRDHTGINFDAHAMHERSDYFQPQNPDGAYALLPRLNLGLATHMHSVVPSSRVPGVWNESLGMHGAVGSNRSAGTPAYMPRHDAAQHEVSGQFEDAGDRHAASLRSAQLRATEEHAFAAEQLKAAAAAQSAAALAVLMETARIAGDEHARLVVLQEDADREDEARARQRQIRQEASVRGAQQAQAARAAFEAAQAAAYASQNPPPPPPLVRHWPRGTRDLFFRTGTRWQTCRVCRLRH
jgi:hypothetical protein